MPSFADHAETLSLIELQGDFAEKIGESLEVAIDALTTLESLCGAMKLNGAKLGSEPSPQEIEAEFDAQGAELRAASVLLADYEDSVQRCEIVFNQLNKLIKDGKTSTDPRTAKGYSDLGSRVLSVRAALELAETF